MFNLDLEIRVWMFSYYSICKTNLVLQTPNKQCNSSVMASLLIIFVNDVDVFYSLFLHVIIIKGHVGPMQQITCN